MPHTPHNRNTRSNSITSAKGTTITEGEPKLDSKTTLEEIRNCLKTEIRTEMKAVMNKLDSLEQKLMDFENVIVKLQNVQEKQDLEIRQLKECIKQADPNALIREAVLRISKRDFLVVSGIPELTSGSVDERRQNDVTAVQEMAHALGCNDLVPEDLQRVGPINQSRPRMIRFKCSSGRSRDVILRSARNLKDSPKFQRVYVSPDLTKAERERGIGSFVWN